MAKSITINLNKPAQKKVTYQGKEVTLYRLSRATAKNKRHSMYVEQNGDVKLINFGDPNSTPNTSRSKWEAYYKRHAVITDKDGKNVINKKGTPSWASAVYLWPNRWGVNSLSYESKGEKITLKFINKR